jgi:hypothetical protein
VIPAYPTVNMVGMDARREVNWLMRVYSMAEANRLADRVQLCVARGWPISARLQVKVDAAMDACLERVRSKL